MKYLLSDVYYCLFIGTILLMSAWAAPPERPLVGIYIEQHCVAVLYEAYGANNAPMHPEDEKTLKIRCK